MKVEEEGTKGILYRRDIICRRTAWIKQEITKFLKIRAIREHCVLLI